MRYLKSNEEVIHGTFWQYPKGNLITGLAIGIGAAILAPVVIPVVAAAAKPLLKAAIKEASSFMKKVKRLLQRQER